jgi:flagella synthesis protein FlgN
VSTATEAQSLALARLLDEEAAALRGFLDLLQKEQDALVRGDAEALLPLAEDKNRHFARLALLAEGRNQALARLGLPADRPGVEAWLAGKGNLAAARRRWQEMLEHLARVRELNRTNGILIATRLQHNQQALQALLSAANQAALYGPDGQARPLGGGRHHLGSG